MRFLSGITTAVVVCLTLFACAADPVPPDSVAIGTCVEQAFRAELHVDVRDPRRVWATDYGSGRDVAVRPRPEERFTFDPDRPTFVFDAEGNVLSFAGEITTTGCFDAGTGTLYVGPLDVPDPNRPPN